MGVMSPYFGSIIQTSTFDAGRRMKNRATREKRSISQEDDHSAEEIVASIRDGRIDSPRFTEDHELFDLYGYHHLQPQR